MCATRMKSSAPRRVWWPPCGSMRAPPTRQGIPKGSLMPFMYDVGISNMLGRAWRRRKFWKWHNFKYPKGRRSIWPRTSGTRNFSSHWKTITTWYSWMTFMMKHLLGLIPTIMVWLTNWLPREVASFTAVGFQRTYYKRQCLRRSLFAFPHPVSWLSLKRFTGYINRIRGYHADKEKLPGYEQGIVNSWYYALADRYDKMQSYHPVKKSFYAREFPTSWRLIDTTLETSWSLPIPPGRLNLDVSWSLSRNSLSSGVPASFVVSWMSALQDLQYLDLCCANWLEILWRTSFPIPANSLACAVCAPVTRSSSYQ